MVIGADDHVIVFQFGDFVPIMIVNNLNAFAGHFVKGNAVVDNPLQVAVKIRIPKKYHVFFKF